MKEPDGKEDDPVGWVTQREHDLLDDKVERYFTMLNNELTKAEINRKEALEQARMTIQLGLDKAERTLQISLDKAERNLQTALEAAEKRVNEKFIVTKESQEKAEGVLLARVGEIERFRDQLTGERALYVTRDQLDLIIKSTRAEAAPLLTQQAWTKGRDAAIWGAILLSAGLAAAAVTLLIRAMAR